jgi:hypothetical protein
MLPQDIIHTLNSCNIICYYIQSLQGKNYLYIITFREIGWDGMDWIDLAQDRDQWRALVNMVMNLQVP